MWFYVRRIVKIEVHLKLWLEALIKLKECFIKDK